MVQNAETLSSKMLRGHIQKDIGCSSDEIAPYKSLIKSLALEIMTKAAATEEKEEAEDEQEELSQESEEESEDEGLVETRPVKVKKKAKKSKAKSTATKQKPASVTTGLSSKSISKAKKVLKEASIRIPPNIYKKNKTLVELESALEALLEKHGLSINSSKKIIRKVKKRLEIERDMDGIDMSNVIHGSKRQRRGTRSSQDDDFVTTFKEMDDSENEKVISASVRKNANVLDSDSD